MPPRLAQPYRAPRCLYKLRANSEHRVDFLLSLSLTLRIFIENPVRVYLPRIFEARRQSHESALGRLQIALPHRSCANDERNPIEVGRNRETDETDEIGSSVEGRTRSVRVKLLTSREIQSRPLPVRPIRFSSLCDRSWKEFRVFDAAKSIGKVNYCLSVCASKSCLPAREESSFSLCLCASERARNEIETLRRLSRINHLQICG